MTKQLSGLTVCGIRKGLVKPSSFQCPLLHWRNLWAGVIVEVNGYACTCKELSIGEIIKSLVCEVEGQIMTNCFVCRCSDKFYFRTLLLATPYQ